MQFSMLIHHTRLLLLVDHAAGIIFLNFENGTRRFRYTTRPEQQADLFFSHHI